MAFASYLASRPWLPVVLKMASRVAFPVAAFLASVFVLKSMFALRALGRAAMVVRQALAQGSLNVKAIA